MTMIWFPFSIQKIIVFVMPGYLNANVLYSLATLSHFPSVIEFFQATFSVQKIYKKKTLRLFAATNSPGLLFGN